MLQSILIAIAISIDSLSVGIAYGIRDIKVPLHSLIVLDMISILLLSMGFVIGGLLNMFIPVHFTQVLGSALLIMIGTWLLLQGWLEYRFPKDGIKNPIPIALISIRSLGIAINILRDPSEADLDISGVIDTKEAILLGFALAIDSLAIGVAVSISSIYLVLFTLLMVSIMNLFFLLLGIKVGKKYLGVCLKRKTQLIPGSILIILGILKIL